MDELVTFFEEKNVPLDRKKILIATSGGPDSMALLDMMRKLVKEPVFQIYVGHIDHCLRKDSKLESELISKYCQKYNLRFFDKKWLVNLHPDHGVEAAARKVRYAFFKELIAKYKIDYLMTAHHGDDLIENILLKFIRSGNAQEMNSLAEIGVFGDAKIIRPLLSWSKKDLKNYVLENKIDYIQDQTNFEDDVLRNRLRHHVVPLLKKENPNLVENANRFMHSQAALQTDQTSLFSTFKVKRRLASLSGEMNELSDLSDPQKLRYFEWLIEKYWERQVHFPNKKISDNLVMQKDGFWALIYQKHYFITRAQTNYNGLANVTLDQKFTFENQQYLISTRNFITGMKKIDYFYIKAGLAMEAGSLPSGAKLRLADGKRVKAKKKFAQAAIPKQLRDRCLAIKAGQEIVYVQDTYRWQKYDDNYQRYNIFLNCEDSVK